MLYDTDSGEVIAAVVRGCYNIDEGKLKIIGKGDNIVDLTSVSNVVNAIVLSLNAKNNVLYNTFNISNGKPIKLWDAIRDTLVKLDKKLPVIFKPLVFLRQPGRGITNVNFIFTYRLCQQGSFQRTHPR